jgi:hypothetical protein
MAFGLNGAIQSTALRDAVVISNDRLCYYCGRAVGYHQPLIIFGLQRPEVIGAAHPDCGYFDLRYAQFFLPAAMALSSQETSFLAHFYFQLFRLPGEGHAQAALRCCLAEWLLDYPAGLSKIAEFVGEFKAANRQALRTYPGDLEVDLYSFLGKIGQATRCAPLDVTVDFLRV